MYNKSQLNDKSMSELQIIAKNLEIAKSDSFEKEELIYKILDEQAFGASKNINPDK
ncbi:MAG: Rho termination factor N-terminal domain-containing protein, partial [Bacteroidaceae bacterium]